MNATDPNVISSYSPLLGASAVCFSGNGWPVDQAVPATSGCGQIDGETGAVALGGFEQGALKSTLCQALLQCLHKSGCAGPPDYEQTSCYCGTEPTSGAVVPLGVCTSSSYTPTGACKDQLLAGLESKQFGNSDAYLNDPCFATGAAFEIYADCDNNCCSQECLGMPPNAYADPTYCNAPGSGSAGTSGSGGTTGAGGSTHAGGSSGSSGTGGAGGAIHTGGTGSGGMTSGAAGTTGAAGSTAIPMLQNVHFDSNIDGWAGDANARVSRSTNDASGGTQSGSLDLTVTGADPNVLLEAGASQCLSVTPGATYLVGVKILIPGQTATEGGLDLWYFSSTNCSGGTAGSFSLPLSATNTWSMVMGSVQLPAGVQSVSVRLVVVKPYGQQSAEALFDDVVVSRK